MLIGKPNLSPVVAREKQSQNNSPTPLNLELYGIPMASIWSNLPLASVFGRVSSKVSCECSTVPSLELQVRSTTTGQTQTSGQTIRGMKRRSAILAVSLSSILAALPFASDIASHANQRVDNQRLDAVDSKAAPKLEELISQLSDPSYAKREAARDAIIAQGISALEELHASSFSSDPQIASASRFLLKSSHFSWENDLDPPSVRNLLTLYGQSTTRMKMDIVEQLASLERKQGVVALCRIARFEPIEEVAKLASLKVLSMPTAVSSTDINPSEEKESHARQILLAVQGGTNEASAWLREFFGSQKFNRDWWVEKAHAELSKVAEDQKKPSSVLDLSHFAFPQWVVERIVEGAKSESATPDNGEVLNGTAREKGLELGAEILALIPGKLPENPARWDRLHSLNEQFAIWALDNQLGELLLAQYQGLDYLFVASNPMFGYYLAEAVGLTGDRKLADEIAEKTYKRAVVQADGSEMVPSDGQDGLGHRFFRNRQRSLGGISGALENVLAASLKKRGQFDWALRELSQGVQGPLTSSLTLRALYETASIHHSLEQFGPAVEVLKPLVERFENEPMFAAQLRLESEVVTMIISAYYQYSGDAAHANGDDQAAMGSYRKALQASKENVDAILGMYRLDLNEADQLERRNLQQESVARLSKLVKDLEKFIKDRPAFNSGGYSLELAIQLNSLAWLIANTEGDYLKALSYAQQACQLAPRSPEFLDTLSHAHFAVGNIQEAVEIQRRAIKMMPHVPEFHRALTKFEAKLSESNSN